MKLASTLIVLTALMAGCSNGKEKLADISSGTEASPKPTDAANAGKQESPVSLMLIRESNLVFESANSDSSRQFIEKSVSRNGGYIQHERTEMNGMQLMSEMVIRVPSVNYDAFVKAVEGHARRVVDKQMNVVDVTSEFVDVHARLKTKYDVEARYRELLKRAVKVEEILEVEAQIAGVRGEIESMEAKLKNMKDRVTYSTVRLNFYEPVIVKETGLFSEFIDAFYTGWNNLLSFLIALVYIWPFIILFTALAFVMARFRKRSRHSPVTS